MNGEQFEIITNSAAETTVAGAAIASWLEPGDVLLLHGDLGAGKTTLVKGIVSALGTETVVSSPSFALVNEYPLEREARLDRLFHLDLYRIDETELETIGLAELLDTPDAVTIIEWPERAGHHLPERYLLVELIAPGDEVRRLRFSLTPSDSISQAREIALRHRLRAPIER